MSEHEILTKADVAKFCRLSLSTLNRLEKRGLFPARIQMGERKVAWFKADILKWLKARKNKRVIIDE